MPFTRRQSRLATQGNPASKKGNQPTTANVVATPKAKSGAIAFFNAITQRAPKTPSEKSPIKPAEADLHPQQHHQTSATPYDEARWLGFFNMGSQTAPAKQPSSFTAAMTSPSPKKVASPSLADQDMLDPPATTSPGFKFTFRREPSVELSDDARKIMEESRAEAARIRAQLATRLPSVPDTELEEGFTMTNGRKIAQPKGKAGRFSDVHKAGFQKMDSIANHASAWRVDPGRNKPENRTLMPSQSKTDLTRPTVSSLKRSPSKAELDRPTSSSSLKRTLSKPNLQKPLPNPFVTKTAISTIPVNFSNAPDEKPKPEPSAKRVKSAREDDAGTTRPKPSASPSVTPRRQTQGLVRSKSGLLRPGFSSAMSPTKSSIARSQSINNLRGGSQIPALARANGIDTPKQDAPSAIPRSKSMRDLSAAQTPHGSPSTYMALQSPSPVKTAYLSHDAPVKAPLALLTSSPAQEATPKRIKSILRTPNRRYTRDPLKIAAGTHLATPPRQAAGYPDVPATEPLAKSVLFTSSTKEDDLAEGKRAASVQPAAAHSPALTYPELNLTDSTRRATLATLPSVPGAFTFESDKQLAFGSPNTSTIRTVRASGVGLPPAFQHIDSAPSALKRKLDPLTEAEEKENRGHEQESEKEQRPAKKARVAEAPPKSAPATPASKMGGRLARFGAKNGGPAKGKAGISAARLSMLARPKRRA